jgi:hypothetical protein
MTFTRRLRRATGLAGVATMALCGLVVGTPIAGADDDPAPAAPLHDVKYTVFSETPFRNAEIYYRDIDPSSFADYSHNPYSFSPRADADTGPNQMWTMDVQLANPDQWAMVTVGNTTSDRKPNFHCVLAVDGKVVVTNQGPKGALCSIRSW